MSTVDFKQIIKDDQMRSLLDYLRIWADSKPDRYFTYNSSYIQMSNGLESWSKKVRMPPSEWDFYRVDEAARELE